MQSLTARSSVSGRRSMRWGRDVEVRPNRRTCRRYRCEYCHAPEAGFNFQFEVDPIHPSSDDGSTMRAISPPVAGPAININQTTPLALIR